MLLRDGYFRFSRLIRAADAIVIFNARLRYWL